MGGELDTVAQLHLGRTAEASVGVPGWSSASQGGPGLAGRDPAPRWGGQVPTGLLPVPPQSGRIALHEFCWLPPKLLLEPVGVASFPSKLTRPLMLASPAQVEGT